MRFFLHSLQALDVKSLKRRLCLCRCCFVSLDEELEDPVIEPGLVSESLVGRWPVAVGLRPFKSSFILVVYVSSRITGAGWSDLSAGNMGWWAGRAPSILCG